MQCLSASFSRYYPLNYLFNSSISQNALIYSFVSYLSKLLRLWRMESFRSDSLSTSVSLFSIFYLLQSAFQWSSWLLLFTSPLMNNSLYTFCASLKMSFTRSNSFWCSTSTLYFYFPSLAESSCICLKCLFLINFRCSLVNIFWTIDDISDFFNWLGISSWWWWWWPPHSPAAGTSACFSSFFPSVASSFFLLWPSPSLSFVPAFSALSAAFSAASRSNYASFSFSFCSLSSFLYQSFISLLF